MTDDLTDDHTCDDALNELYQFIDGELDDDGRARIESHLNNCSPCLEAFDFEADLRKVVAQRCQERVPDELRQRILDALEGSEPDPA
ncbi:MAG TPA: mycothiol system anti-sigma-R factor [Microthrixaceae bacterium]|nr:mycothiol system anti-sigma-R factor [Microthrixaceae bacterium]